MARGRARGGPDEPLEGVLPHGVIAAQRQQILVGNLRPLLLRAGRDLGSVSCYERY
jgi:hypothetical protein